MPTLKELILEKQVLTGQAQQIVASIQPQLKPIEEKINEIDKQIQSKVSEPAKQKLLETKKDTGTANLPIEGVLVKMTVSKTVKWNQNGLAQVFERIKSAGDDPCQYINIEYGVSENSYKAWPDQIKSVFAPHRTVTPSKPRFEYHIIEDAPKVEEADTVKPPWEG
jgi:hypothetical protein